MSFGARTNAKEKQSIYLYCILLKKSYKKLLDVHRCLKFLEEIVN